MELNTVPFAYPTYGPDADGNIVQLTPGAGLVRGFEVVGTLTGERTEADLESFVDGIMGRIPAATRNGVVLSVLVDIDPTEQIIWRDAAGAVLPDQNGAITREISLVNPPTGATVDYPSFVGSGIYNIVTRVSGQKQVIAKSRARIGSVGTWINQPFPMRMFVDVYNDQDVMVLRVDITENLAGVIIDAPGEGMFTIRITAEEECPRTSPYDPPCICSPGHLSYP